MREYHAVLAELEVWRDKKAQRMLQYERLQARFLPSHLLGDSWRPSLFVWT